MAMSIAFIPLSTIRTDDILSSLQQLFLDLSYRYTSKRAVYIQLKQSLHAKLAKNFKIIQGKLGKNGSSLISCYLHSKDMLLQLQPIVLRHWFVERFQVQHYLKRHSNLKSYSNTHSSQFQWNTKLPAVFAKFYTMHVYVFSHVCKKNRTVQLYIYQYTYSQSILFTFIWSASLFKCFS